MAGERMGSTALNLRTPEPGLLMAGLMAAAAVDVGVWRELGR